MLSSIALVSATKGDLIAFRAYRDDVSVKSSINFASEIVESRLLTEVAPIQLIDGTSFFFTVEEHVVFVAASRANSNAALIFEFLKRLAICLKQRLSGSKAKLDDTIVRRHISQVYEIFDESFDHGIPQLCDADIMKKCLMVESKTKFELCTASQLGEITATVTAAASRPDGIKHLSNEIWLDVEEKVNVLAGPNGQVHAAHVDGVVNLRSRLSGMPECHLGFNDALPLQRSSGNSDSVQLHQCVRVEPGVNDVRLTPPEGKCTIIQYRATTHLRIPVQIFAQMMEKSRNRVEFTIRIRGLVSASKLVIGIPCPPNSLKMNLISCEAGYAKFIPEEERVVWNVRRLSPPKEIALICEVERVSAVNGKPWHHKKCPISLDFEMPMTTASGLMVRFLRVTEKRLNYDSVKWIRYITRAGSFEIRM